MNRRMHYCPQKYRVFFFDIRVILLTCKVAFFLGIKYPKATRCHYQSHKYYCSDDTTYIEVICNYKTEVQCCKL